ncbi:hypothetical protein BT96DRAFT_66838 [Gymnopus androsaceus JB14]|uniref:Uncharacterized protein n=1 Tax=Gymnopus androsaceus JB14 TaxID=1447944 RepID=A0A6A4HJE9_9AGAR|nr:hypothetical protein BT96DRAFT_66838 [Gymnopus androsaceus JB14]
MPERGSCPSCGMDLADPDPELSSISEIKNLLQSNDEPLPTIKADLLSRQSVVESSLADIVERVKGLKSAIERLKKHQKALQSDSESCKIILHVARKVPDDVWVIIFEMATITQCGSSSQPLPAPVANSRITQALWNLS